MSLQSEHGYGARRFSEANPETILIRILKKNPEATIKDINELFTEAVERSRSRDEIQLAIILYYVINNVRKLRLRLSPPSAAAKKAERAAVSAVADKTKEKVVEATHRLYLMSIVIPVGKIEKRLADCTKKDLERYCGWLGEVSALVKPGRTVAESGITEKQLQRLHARKL